MPHRIAQAETSAQVAQVRELFQEYAASLGFSLCFQSFEEELASLPGDYAPPSGRLLLATIGPAPAGCVALHRFVSSSLPPETANAGRIVAKHDIAEMKRLYVRPAFRGHLLGRALLEAAIAQALDAGYYRLRLDTVPSVMAAAVALYRAYGFREISPYRPNPIEGALYMELDLASFAAGKIARPRPVAKGD